MSSAIQRRNRIVVDPEVLSGEPFVRGTRIPVSVILDGLAEGLSQNELRAHYPRLTTDDILSAIEYAATHTVLLEHSVVA